MYNEVIKLIKETVSSDAIGNPISTRTERLIFAEAYSVGQQEFYQAATAGLKPTMKFRIADYLDYQGENLLSYAPYGADQEEVYSIIRTYRTGNELEITCERKVGVS